MPQIIPPGYCSVVIHLASADYTDGEALITMGVRASAGPTASDIAVAVAQVLASSNLDAFLTNTATIPLVEAYTDATSGAATTTIEGQNSQAMPPPNVSLLVEKRTPVRGRRAQGRNFWPGLVAESLINQRGEINPLNVADLQSLFDELHTALVTAEVPPVILQNSEGISAPIDPPPPVTRFVVDPLVSTQRRRLRR